MQHILEVREILTNKIRKNIILFHFIFFYQIHYLMHIFNIVTNKMKKWQKDSKIK